MGLEADDPRRRVRCLRSRLHSRLRASSRRSASPSSAGRAACGREPIRREKKSTRFSLAAMFLAAGRSLFCSRGCSGVVIDSLSPVVRQALVGEEMPKQLRSAAPWLSIIPIAESRKFLQRHDVILISPGHFQRAHRRNSIHRFVFATRATRRSPIWDCGYPDPGSPATQYKTGSSFAMPLRRVFGGDTLFQRSRADRYAAARRDARWTLLKGRSFRSRVDALHLWPNRDALTRNHRKPAQLPSVSDYPALSDAHLLGAHRPSSRGVGGMALILDPAVQLGAPALQMILVLLIAPLVIGITRKVKARLLRRKGPSLLQPYRDIQAEAAAQGSRGGRERILALSRSALRFVRRHVARCLCSCRSWRPVCCSAGPPTSLTWLRWSRWAVFRRARRNGYWHLIWRHRSSREMMIGLLAEPAMLMTSSR